MSLGEKYVTNAAKAAAKLLDEPVVHVAFGSRSGAMKSLVTSEVTGIGGMAPRDVIHREGGKNTKLPLNFLIIVTPSKVHVYQHKMFWGSIKIKKELGVFERAGLQVQVGDSTVRQFQISSVNPPQAMHFEMARLGKGAAAMIDELTRLLQTPPSS
jgi:hypothetical protein